MYTVLFMLKSVLVTYMNTKLSCWLQSLNSIKKFMKIVTDLLTKLVKT